jgi:hypothetical protein
VTILALTENTEKERKPVLLQFSEVVIVNVAGGARQNGWNSSSATFILRSTKLQKNQKTQKMHRNKKKDY